MLSEFVPMYRRNSESNCCKSKTLQNRKRNKVAVFKFVKKLGSPGANPLPTKTKDTTVRHSNDKSSTNCIEVLNNF